MRGWFIKAVATVVMVGMWVGQARAEASLNEILRDYDNPKASEAQRAMISSNLVSMEVGLGWANTALRAQRMQAGLYCPPDKPSITAAQLIDILRRALKEEPRLGDRPAGFALLTALQRSFPCS
jgi:hypothetical protein